MILLPNFFQGCLSSFRNFFKLHIEISKNNQAILEILSSSRIFFYLGIHLEISPRVRRKYFTNCSRNCCMERLLPKIFKSYGSFLQGFFMSFLHRLVYKFLREFRQPNLLPGLFRDLFKYFPSIPLENIT